MGGCAGFGEKERVGYIYTQATGYIYYGESIDTRLIM